jgi:hypothetical protein
MDCNFVFQVFKKIEIVICSCMLLENVMQVFHLLLPHILVDQFVFIWGHEQWTRTLGQFIVGTYYYLKDLNSVYTFHVEG